MLDNLKARARTLKADIYALYLAYRDPRVPWYAKAFAALVVGYAVSPVDLVPDFIPLLGYLDDLVLLPLGISLALRMIPSDVMEECRAIARSSQADGRRLVSWTAGVFILLIWAVLLIWAARTALGILRG